MLPRRRLVVGILGASSLAAAIIVNCAPSSNPVGAAEPFFPDGDGGEVPDGALIRYQDGGQFTVGTRIYIPNLRQSTHATIEIIEPFTPTGAVLSGTSILTDQGQSAMFSGSTQLTWPPGGDVPLRIQIAGQTIFSTAHLEVPAKIDFDVTLGTPTSKGTVPLCVTSTALDGQAVSIHLEGATIAGATTSDLTAPLLPEGSCPGFSASPLASAKSHAAVFSVAPGTGGTFWITTSVPGSSAVRKQKQVTIAVPVAITLALSAPGGTSPPKLSTVTVVAHAELSGASAKGATIQFEATAAIAMVPSSAITDDAGNATSHFQMPASGAVHVDGISGDVSATIDFQ